MHVPGWFFQGRVPTLAGFVQRAVPIAALGLLFGWTKRRGGSLDAPILVHAINNLYSAFLIRMRRPRCALRVRSPQARWLECYILARMRDAIGRYRVTGPLGEGGMGLVYAWTYRPRPPGCREDGSRGQLEDLQARERFWREARGPAVSAIRTSFTSTRLARPASTVSSPWSGSRARSLAERFPGQRGPLPPPEAAQVATRRSARYALEAVHAHGLLHRDLKPSNVFLTPHGVKLLDFGLAAPILTSDDPDHTVPQLTLPGTVLGTPGYMAPETIGKPVDARSDLYSLGAMLFNRLLGARPFEAGSPAEILLLVRCRSGHQH